MDRATLLTYVWEYVALALIAIAGLRANRAGGLAEAGAIGLFLGGSMLLVFGLRDHLYRDKREMRAQQDSRLWLALTAFAAAVVTYSLALTVAAGF